MSASNPNRMRRDEDFQALEAFARGFEDVPVAKLEREVANALRQVRAERRREREHQATSDA